jgi:hypothetical protein
VIRDDGGPGLWGNAAPAGRGEQTDEPGLLVVVLGNVIMIAAFWLAYGLIVLGAQAGCSALFLKIHGKPVYWVLAGVLGFLILGGVIYVARDVANWKSAAVAQIFASTVAALVALFGTDFSAGGIAAFIAAGFTAANGIKRFIDISEDKAKATKT